MLEIRVKQDANAKPRCPHCEKDLQEINYNELKGETFGKQYVYSCSACHKVLGVSHRKGFWMG